MSQSQKESALLKLNSLINAVQPIVSAHIEQMSAAEIHYIIQNFSRHLKLDLLRDFEKAREKGLKDSPFDDILSDFKLDKK
jgi:hypothetical protein